METRAQDQPVSAVLQGTRFQRHCDRLSRAGMVTASDLVCKSSQLDVLLKGVPSEDVQEIRLLCSRAFLPVLDTPLTMLPPRRLSWGCPRLNAVWGGGLDLAGVTEFCGEAGSGKTQLALWLAGQNEGAVMYISTEGEFPAGRFKQFHVRLLAVQIDFLSSFFFFFFVF